MRWSVSRGCRAVGACDGILLTGCSVINQGLAAGKGPECGSCRLPANPTAPTGPPFLPHQPLLPPAPDPPGPMQKPAMMPITQATTT